MNSTGHPIRMRDGKLSKQLFYCELTCGKCLKYKVNNILRMLKTILKILVLLVGTKKCWPVIYVDENGKQGIQGKEVQSCKSFLESRTWPQSQIILKLTIHATIVVGVFLSEADFTSHLRCHYCKQSQADYIDSHPQWNLC